MRFVMRWSIPPHYRERLMQRLFCKPAFLLPMRRSGSINFIKVKSNGKEETPWDTFAF